MDSTGSSIHRKAGALGHSWSLTLVLMRSVSTSAHLTLSWRLDAPGTDCTRRAAAGNSREERSRIREKRRQSAQRACNRRPWDAGPPGSSGCRCALPAGQAADRPAAATLRRLAGAGPVRDETEVLLDACA